MRTPWLFTLAVVVAALTLAADSPMPKFSGVWVLDKEQTQAAAGGPSGRERIVIEHSEPRLTIKGRIQLQDGEEFSYEYKYTTDGKENANQGPLKTPILSRTHWEGRQLVTESRSESPRGKTTTRIARSLSADGKRMTVNISGQGWRGNIDTTLVYSKE